MSFMFQAFSMAMAAHVAELRNLNCLKLALRVEISVEKTEYIAGSNGVLFKPPSAITDSLDTHLVPLVFEEATRVQSTAPINVELHFHLLEISHT